jgi:UDP-N-acetylglucosamine 1-carboxyvinyltransferase
MKNFLIKGGKKLSGSISVEGSKNAVLPIIAASLLTTQPTTLTNVPEIEDVYQITRILNFLNVKTEFSNGTLKIDPSNLENKYIEDEFVKNMRASILLAGALIGRFKEANMGYPGGCVLGKRSVDTHILAFAKLGAQLVENHTKIHLRAEKLIGTEITLSEFSVTGTENIVMAAVLAEGETVIKIAAAEPHVQDLCIFLNKMGAKIEGIGSHTLKITGVNSLSGVEHKVRADYLEAGTLILAGAITNSQIEVTDFETEDLDLFFEKLEEIGVVFEKTKNTAKIISSSDLSAISSLKTAVHPGFPTDLFAPFSVLLTQASGVSKIYETLFEGRFNYLFELEKMDGRVELLNPHQALVIGPRQLKGVPVASCDILAGAAVVLAALVAEGETLITNINYIDRGYQKLDEKLNSLGADIQRI